MNHSDSQLDQIQSKVNDLEASLGYLQRDYESQNEMILVDAKRILELEKAVKRLAKNVESLSGQNEPERNPEDEKPPHY